MNYQLFWRLLVIPIFLLLSCTTTSEFVPYGVQEEHASFVPARIAVLPCQVWPNGARYKSLPMSNIKELEIQELCKQFDKFVIDGFKDQPYMRGFSPKWVMKFLTESNFSGGIDQIRTLWRHNKGDCSQCQNPPSFYKSSISSRVDWRTWLNNFSKAVRNADAVLVPFIFYAFETSYNDRGIHVAKKAAGATLLLIDTNNANLLWAGGREAETANQKAETKNKKQELKSPDWPVLFGRLYISDMWQEFPGRQVYN